MCGRASMRLRAENCPSTRSLAGRARDDEGALAGLGLGEPECRAGAQGLADDRAADRELGGKHRFGAELVPHGQLAGLDGVPNGLENGFGRTDPNDGLRSGRPAV